MKELTPQELRRALDMLDFVIEGDATPEQRAAAKEDLQVIRALLRDVRSGPDDVLIGRQASVIKPSVTLMKLQCVAPPGALDGILKWVEAQAGTRGRRTQEFTIVTDDGAWTQMHEEQPPVVYRRA